MNFHMHSFLTCLIRTLLLSIFACTLFIRTNDAAASVTYTHKVDGTPLEIDEVSKMEVEFFTLIVGHKTKAFPISLYQNDFHGWVLRPNEGRVNGLPYALQINAKSVYRKYKAVTNLFPLSNIILIKVEILSAYFGRTKKKHVYNPRIDITPFFFDYMTCHDVELWKNTFSAYDYRYVKMEFPPN